MTLLTPPGYLQAGTYTAALDRQYLVSALYQPWITEVYRARSGVLNNHDNMSAGVSASGLNVTVGPFRVVITNTFAAGGAGDYIGVSVANETRTMAASSTTLNRIDTLGVLVRDAFYSGVNNDVDVVILAGTAVAGTPSPPTRPNGFIPLWDLTLNANATTPTFTDVRKRTGLVGAPVRTFANQLADAGVWPGEEQYLPKSGAMPFRKRVWGDDSTWHGVQDYVLTAGSWVLTTSNADRIVASLSVADPGYPYQLFWSGSVWGSFDGNQGWRFMARQGVTAGGTILSGQGAWQDLDPDAPFYNGISCPITGSSGTLTGAQTISIWAQRKAGSTQNATINSESSVSCLVVPV